jgi:hypothetical protein
VAADRIRLAETNPAHCSACFQGKPQSRHIDFGAAWDGPVIPGEGVVQHVIDDLIICEACLRDAGRQLGLGDVDKVTEELRNAERENDRLMENVRGLKAYAANLENARDSRPNELLDPPKAKSKPRARQAA